MNETDEWLYAKYALPLMRRDEDAIRRLIPPLGTPEDRLKLQDGIGTLCLRWGAESFSLGLQLGLRLMAGQCADALML